MEVDQELAAAQAALAAAMQRKEEVSKLALDKIKVELAERKAAAEREQQAEQELRENTIKRAREAMQRKSEEEAQRKAKQKAEDDLLERQLSIREEQIRQENKRQEEVRRVQQQVFLVEQEARSIEADLIRSRETRYEPEPVTLHSPGHPLSRLFGVTQQEPPVTPVVENVQQAPTLDCVTVSDKRKPQGQRYIDILTSKQIEEHIKRELNVSANPTRCDQLSAEWNDVTLMAAVRSAVAQAKAKPMSHDGLLSLIENTLEAASD